MRDENKPSPAKVTLVQKAHGNNVMKSCSNNCGIVRHASSDAERC